MKKLSKISKKRENFRKTGKKRQKSRKIMLKIRGKTNKNSKKPIKNVKKLKNYRKTVKNTEKLKKISKNW